MLLRREEIKSAIGLYMVVSGEMVSEDCLQKQWYMSYSPVLMKWSAMSRLSDCGLYSVGRDVLMGVSAFLMDLPSMDMAEYAFLLCSLMFDMILAFC